MTTNPQVSLIICTYNRETELVNTIKYALKQSYRNLEIIIVDQTTKHEPETESSLASVKGKITYIFSDTPSLTKARNIGLQNANSEIIIYVDDDTQFEPDFVTNHVAAHEKYDVVQGRIVERNEPAPANARPQWLSWYLKFRGTNNCLTEGPTNTITGCNFSLKKTVISRVGLFDENYSRLALREDADFAQRCYRTGVSMGFYPSAMVHHLRSSSGGVDSGVGQHYFSDSYYYNEFLFAGKHFSKLAHRYYKIRLYLRGMKALKKVIKKSESEVQKKLKEYKSRG